MQHPRVGPFAQGKPLAGSAQEGGGVRGVPVRKQVRQQHRLLRSGSALALHAGKECLRRRGEAEGHQRGRHLPRGELALQRWPAALALIVQPSEAEPDPLYALPHPGYGHWRISHDPEQECGPAADHAESGEHILAPDRRRAPPRAHTDDGGTRSPDLHLDGGDVSLRPRYQASGTGTDLDVAERLEERGSGGEEKRLRGANRAQVGGVRPERGRRRPPHLAEGARQRARRGEDRGRAHHLRPVRTGSHGLPRVILHDQYQRGPLAPAGFGEVGSG